MPRKQIRLPSIAVIGLGDYYTKLRKSMWKYFKPMALIDNDSSAMQRLSRDERPLFRWLDPYEKIDSLLSSAEVVMVLTPNDSHASYAADVAKLRKAVVIEKPIATNAAGLMCLAALAQKELALYFSDFYVDIRATPLLVAANRLQADDWRRELIRRNSAFEPSIADIGPIRRLHGRIFESHPFRSDSWLGRSSAGGVIFDLMVHLFALVKYLFPEEELEIKKCQRLFLGSSAAPSHYVERPPTQDVGEAFAQVEGLLIPSKIEVLFDVEKSAQSEDRHFTLEGTSGLITQRFEQNHPLKLETNAKDVLVELEGDRYELTCRALRRWCDTGAKTYGWEWNSWAAGKAMEARSWRPATATVTRKPRSSYAETTLPPTPLPSRREFLLLAGTFVLELVSAGHHVADEYRYFRDKRNVITSDLARRADRSEPWLDSERVAKLAALFGVHDRLVLAPGTEHLYKHTWQASLRGYPHDLNAIAPFRYLTPSAAEVLEVDGIPGALQPSDVVIATGSPTSSGIARLLMAPGSTFENKNLRYRIEEIDAKPFVTVRSGMEGFKETRKRGKQLIDVRSHDVLYSDHHGLDRRGWLKQDVLLVSRLPGIRTDSDVLLLSGFHGAGTQAAELLFRKNIFSTEDLEQLCALLDGGRYWQFVLEVSDLSHELMTTAHVIRLSPRCPPTIITPRGRHDEGQVA
jgi:predicted dehydrogenase